MSEAQTSRSELRGTPRRAQRLWLDVIGIVRRAKDAGLHGSLVHYPERKRHGDMNLDGSRMSTAAAIPCVSGMMRKAPLSKERIQVARAHLCGKIWRRRQGLCRHSPVDGKTTCCKSGPLVGRINARSWCRINTATGSFSAP